MDAECDMQQGSVPWERLTGAPPVVTPGSQKVVPLALTTGYTSSPASKSRSARIPMRYNADLGRFRVHIRNWNPRLGTVVAAPVNFTGLWLANTPGGGAITGTPVQLASAFTTPADGNEWVSDWHTAPLGGNVERLLCYGYETAQAPWGLTGGSYQAAGSASAITGTVSRAQITAFDIWIEAETPASTPVIAGIGDSLTAGVGAKLPMHESWLSQYARRVGGLPMHIAQSGDSMRGFITVNNAKYTRWKHLAHADAVVWALGSNDVAGTQTLDVMKQYYGTLAPIVERDIGPIRYAATVPPRNGWDAAAEAKRAEWNAWLTARPEMRGVLDFASVVSADGATLRPEYDSGDGTHLNTAGYTAEQASITALLAAPQPATTARVAGLETDSGLRDLTTLFSLSSGTAYLHVKGGWVWLLFNNAAPATTGAVELTATGLASVAPQAPVGSAEGILGASDAANPRRLEVSRNGKARVLGVTTGDILNGSISWPMTRPAPPTWPGDPTT